MIGIVEIFAVNRTTTGDQAAAVGKSSIFRSRAHWEPCVVQSDRGMAMFLSSLRVFTSLVQDMRDDDRSQDAVLHVFDLLAEKFAPGVRALHILFQGKTPTAAESAALSQAMFEILDGFIPTVIIGTDHSRVFEGARLLVGFILEKARTIKLADEAGATMPYLGGFHTTELRDYRTNEAVMHAVQTSDGMVEGSLFEAFSSTGALAESHLQCFMVRSECNHATERHALLSGGVTTEIIVFSRSALSENYRYPDHGNIGAAIDLDELSELGHLAELCGRNKLAVHKPSQLASAVAPCLTFDRSAHLAVYTGEQPCGAPGQSSLLFRPKSGEETIDAAVVEQLIAPILRTYEADGTAVFDALGGAAVRRLQAPDEILMFCVDCSASMRKATDFTEVNEAEPMFSEEASAQSLVEVDFYNRTNFEDMKEQLCEYEAFEDMVAIVADAGSSNRMRPVSTQALNILRMMLSTEIVKKSKDLEKRRQHATRWYHTRQEIPELQAALDKLKAFWAGLKTHEEAICDFLIYRASSSSCGIAQRWSWSLDDDVPTMTPAQQIPSLPADVTELPHHLKCPISHTLMEDAVTAADAHVYSHTAITQWFSIPRSSHIISPMTGLQLSDTSLESKQDICDAAVRWANGDGLPGRDGGETKRLRSSNDLQITFDSRVGSFQRNISPNMTLKDLYKLAFRSLKARFLTFQLSTDRYGPLTPTPEATATSRGIQDGDHITVRIAEDSPTNNASEPTAASGTGNLVLIKIYERTDDMMLAFWVKRETTLSLASVLWKYWRYQMRGYGYVYITEKQVWSDMAHSGDGLLTGQPRPATDKVASLLTRAHCFGHLGPEKVYREEDVHREISYDQPLVLKVSVQGPWKPKKERNYLSRLDVLKQMFEVCITLTISSISGIDTDPS